MRIIKKIFMVVSFLVYYFGKVIQSNIYIAYDILTPNLNASPEFFWIPIKVKSDFGILLLSNLISMTPGTLSVEITSDKKRLLVHSLYHNLDGKIFSEIDKVQSKIINLTT